MQCLICRKDYIALGVHIRHKHKIDPDEYRDEFGMLRTTPLVDAELSAVLRSSMLRQMEDPERMAQMMASCAVNAQTAVGRPSPGMSDAGKSLLAGRNTARNAIYLQGKSALVAALVREHKSIHAVRKIIGMGSKATKSIIAKTPTGYSKEESLALRLQAATATQHAKRAKRIAAYHASIKGAQSAAEACRMAGITIKTYKNWLAAGAIQKHPRIRR